MLDAHRMARERGANPSSWSHKLDRQSDNGSTYPLPTAELATPVVRGEWQREDDERLRGDGKTLPTIILQQLWHHLYLSLATRLTACEKLFFCVIIFSFVNICFLSYCYINQNGFRIKPYKISDLSDLIPIISSSIHDQEIIK